MNTNTMELNMNEMENVCGGSFWKTVAMDAATGIEKRKIEGAGDVLATCIGGFEGTVKGLKRGFVNWLFRIDD